MCWLNEDPDLHLYWDDSSYVQTTEADAVKIFYYEGDHSAVKSATHAGKYESKWGNWPLVRHSPDYAPYYNMQNRRYYKLFCPTFVNFKNKTITTNTTITSCGSINVQNIEVMPNNKLKLNAKKEVNINAGFEIQAGAEFEINITP